MHSTKTRTLLVFLFLFPFFAFFLDDDDTTHCSEREERERETNERSHYTLLFLHDNMEEVNEHIFNDSNFSPGTIDRKDHIKT